MEDCYDKQSLENDIIGRNKVNETEFYRVTHTYKNKITIKINAIIKVNVKVYQYVMVQEKIYIGCQRYRVFNDVNIGRCYKCCGYGHNGSTQ